MKISLSLLAILLLGLLLTAMYAPASSEGQATKSSAESRRPELAYYEAINKIGPPEDPQLLFLLMSQYSNSNKQAEGVEFLAARLNEFGPRLTAPQKALYLSAIALLRAQNASNVSLLHRVGYVKEAIATLDQAKQLSGGKIFVVNWISGIVRSQLPGFFRQKNAAQQDLSWCIENSEKAPHSGWMREIYYHIGKLADDSGDQTRAQSFLRRSGYTGFDRPITLLTPFTEQAATGHTFAPRQITEVIPHKVYLLSGYEFTEYYFVLSDDGRELVAIDAGTRPDAAKAAYEVLHAYAPGLPELTTVFVTHAHWDHWWPQILSFAKSAHPLLRPQQLSGGADARAQWPWHPRQAILWRTLQLC
jgi:Metallo-beta-lactamase superfamily